MQKAKGESDARIRSNDLNVRLNPAPTPTGDPSSQVVAEDVSARDVWSRAAVDLKAHLSEGHFSAWFSRVDPVRIDGGSFILEVPNAFTKEWIEARYHDAVCRAVSSAAERTLQVVLVAADSTTTSEVEPAHPDSAPAPTDTSHAPHEARPQFYARYNFDSFVIGPSNRFAHAAALAIAEAPAQAYNPLFIYAGAGLGKTHLLHAIGHYVRDFHPHLLTRYISTEQFLNEFVLALQRRTIPEFHSRYRAADVLLVDDIQFLEGRGGLQEEFFHTFNALHPKSQLVITSDRPPKKIPTIKERLTTRFEWGLMTDIQPPDLETRLAILRKKAEADALQLPADVMSFIADRVQTNIRELEGALIRVTAYASLTRAEITRELAHSVLQSVLPDGAEARVTPDLIISVTAEYFDVTPDDIRSPSRSRSLVNARQVAMYLCRELTDLSLPKIGERFGNRDHSTVVHATTKVRNQMREQEVSYDQVRELTARVRQRATRG